MPHISELKQSKFLTKTDCGKGILVTIRECFQENVAKEGAPPENKWCLSFDEADKPMVLNSTNGQIIASIIGSENTDDWIGHKIVLYEDPTIAFGGKLVGGIRARAPRNQPKPAPKPVAAPAPAPAAVQPAPASGPEADDVPF